MQYVYSSCHGFHFLLAPPTPVLLLLSVFELLHQAHAHPSTYPQVSCLSSSPFSSSFCFSPYHILPLMTMMKVIWTMRRMRRMRMMRMMMEMERMTSPLSLLTVALHLSSVPFPPFFSFSSPLWLCPYHPHHPVPYILLLCCIIRLVLLFRLLLSFRCLFLP